MTAEVQAEPGASGLCPGEWRTARVGVEPGEGWETQAGSGRHPRLPDTGDAGKLLPGVGGEGG